MDFAVSFSSVALLLQGVGFRWGKGTTRSVAETWETPLKIAPSQESSKPHASAAASVLPCEDPGTSSKASFLYMVKATMGGRKTEGQGRQLWFWRVTSYTNGMRTCSWYFTSFSLVAVSVEGRLLTENMDVSDSPLVLPALFMVSYQLVLQENSEGG